MVELEERPPRLFTLTRILQPATTGGGAGLRRNPVGRVSPTKRKGGAAAPRRHVALLTSGMPSLQPAHEDQPEKKGAESASAPDAAIHAAEMSQERHQEQQPPLPPPQSFTLFPVDDPFMSPSAATKATTTTTSPGKYHAISSPVRASAPRPSLSPSVSKRSPSDRRPAAKRLGSGTSTFSTPGRDEMERKKGGARAWDGDDGPFGHVKGVKDLEQSRRRISEGSRKGKGAANEKWCRCRCAIM